METLKQAPEISRVMPFYTDETLQIFGENLPQAVVYWWAAGKRADARVLGMGDADAAQDPAAGRRAT